MIYMSDKEICILQSSCKVHFSFSHTDWFFFHSGKPLTPFFVIEIKVMLYGNHKLQYRCLNNTHLVSLVQFKSPGNFWKNRIGHVLDVHHLHIFNLYLYGMCLCIFFQLQEQYKSVPGFIGIDIFRYVLIYNSYVEREC